MNEAVEEENYEIAVRIRQLRHMALRNANYHQARRRWLDGASRVFNLVIILAGTGTAAEVTRGSPTAALILGGLIALAGSLQLVFDYTGRARLHDILQRRYFHLMADIECAKDPDNATCDKWFSEFSRAAADEPPTLRALDAIADNQATFALFGGTERRLTITRWQSATRQVLAHNGGTFAIRPEWAAEHDANKIHNTA